MIPVNTRRHFTTVAIMALFIFFAAASAKINKIHCGAFNYYKKESTDDRPYLVLKDGRKIYGDDVSWKTGLLVKDEIKINGEKYKIKDTRGYFSNGTYYGNLGSSYAKRIVHGKLNVYYTESNVSVASTNSRTGVTTWRDRLVCSHYVQVGEEGSLEPIAAQKDIIKYVKDCPKSLEMIDKKDKEIRKAIKKNSNYLNEIFETYNNGCR